MGSLTIKACCNTGICFTEYSEKAGDYGINGLVSIYFNFSISTCYKNFTLKDSYKMTGISQVSFFTKRYHNAKQTVHMQHMQYMTKLINEGTN